MALSSQEKANIIEFLQQGNISAITHFFEKNASKRRAILRCVAIRANTIQPSLLIFLMKTKQINFIRLLVNEGFDLSIAASFTDSHGNFPIHLATQHQDYELIEMLLIADIKYVCNPQHLPMIEQLNQNKKSPLKIALDNNDQKAVGLLLRFNASFYLLEDEPSTCQYDKHLDILLQNEPGINQLYLSRVLLSCQSYLFQLSVNSDEFQAALDILAYRLIGLRNTSPEIETTHWGHLLADLLSTIKHIAIHKHKYKFGEDFDNESNYLLTHIRCLLEIYFNPRRQNFKRELGEKLLQELITAIETAKISLEISLIQSFDPKPRWRGKLAIAHNKAIQKRARTLPNKHSFCYPSGWITKDTIGHAFYTNVHKIDVTTLEVNMVNLGALSPKDLKCSDGDRYLSAEKKIHCQDEKTIASFFVATTNLSTKIHNPKHVSKLVKNLYLRNLFGSPIGTDTSYEFSEIKQSKGNCIVKNYLYSLRLRLKNDHQYRLIYLFALSTSLERLLEALPLDQMPSLRNIFKHVHRSEASFDVFSFKEFKRQFGHMFIGLTSNTIKIPEFSRNYSSMRQSILFIAAGVSRFNKGHKALETTHSVGKPEHKY